MGLLIVLLAIGSQLGAQSNPTAVGAVSDRATLNEVLAQVRANVRQSWESMPDFVCRERITSQASEKSKVTQTTVVESIFTGARKRRGDAFVMTESREITAIDGTPVHRTQLPAAPLLPDNSVANLLFAAFVIDAHEYKWREVENSGSRSTIQIDLSTRKDQKSFVIGFERKPFVAKDAGKAWIDRESMQVTRLELRILNMPGVEAFSTTAVYEPLLLDGRKFWLPKTVTAESTGGKGKKKDYVASFVAEYTGCKKFEVTVNITQ